jgi:GAF domain-containing protein
VRGDSERRADALAEALVGLADTLVDDYDVIQLLHRLNAFCVRLLPISSAGILLSDQQGRLQVMSASTDETRKALQFQLDVGKGPGLECFRTSREAAVAELRDDGHRWPDFASHAWQSGFRAVHAIPLRLRTETIGALNLFRTEPGLLIEEDVRIGQALADMATIGILHERAVSRRTLVVGQLQTALTSRVIIEQAKGVLTERCRIHMGEAFSLMRRHARNNNLRLAEVAAGVVNGTLVLTTEGNDPGD